MRWSKVCLHSPWLVGSVVIIRLVQTSINEPLLNIPKAFHRDAVRTFKGIQLVMGDTNSNGSSSPGRGKMVNVLEEERWLIAQGILHGEMRDEIYCQVVKQLNDCPTLYVLFSSSP